MELPQESVLNNERIQNMRKLLDVELAAKMPKRDPFDQASEYKVEPSQDFVTQTGKCDKCFRVQSSCLVLHCKHILCVACVHKCIVETDENTQNSGYLMCCVCKRLFSTTTGFTQENTQNLYAQLDNKNSNECLGFEKLQGNLQTSDSLPRYCSLCRNFMQSQQQCFCLECQEYMCHSCAHSFAHRAHAGANGPQIHRMTYLKQGVPIEEVVVNNISQPVKYKNYDDFCSTGTSHCVVHDAQQQSARIANLVNSELGRNESEYRNIECSVHPGEPVQFTCISCHSLCICAMCCIGKDALHGKGHTVLDINSAWDAISYKLNASEKARNIGRRDEFQRLVEQCATVASGLQNVMEKSANAFLSFHKDCCEAVKQNQLQVEATIAETALYINEELLDKNIKDDSVTSHIPAVFSINAAINANNPATIINYYNIWKKKLQHFPPNLSSFRLKHNAAEAKLEKAKFILRWMQEQVGLYYIAAAEFQQLLKEDSIAQRITTVKSPASHFVAKTLPHSQFMQFAAAPEPIINPLGKSQIMNVQPAIYRNLNNSSSYPDPETLEKLHKKVMS